MPTFSPNGASKGRNPLSPQKLMPCPSSSRVSKSPRHNRNCENSPNPKAGFQEPRSYTTGRRHEFRALADLSNTGKESPRAKSEKRPHTEDEEESPSKRLCRPQESCRSQESCRQHPVWAGPILLPPNSNFVKKQLFPMCERDGASHSKPFQPVGDGYVAEPISRRSEDSPRGESAPESCNSSTVVNSDEEPYVDVDGDVCPSPILIPREEEPSAHTHGSAGALPAGVRGNDTDHLSPRDSRGGEAIPPQENPIKNNCTDFSIATILKKDSVKRKIGQEKEPMETSNQPRLSTDLSFLFGGISGVQPPYLRPNDLMTLSAFGSTNAYYCNTRPYYQYNTGLPYYGGIPHHSGVHAFPMMRKDNSPREAPIARTALQDVTQREPCRAQPISRSTIDVGDPVDSSGADSGKDALMTGSANEGRNATTPETSLTLQARSPENTSSAKSSQNPSQARRRRSQPRPQRSTVPDENLLNEQRNYVYMECRADDHYILNPKVKEGNRLEEGNTLKEGDSVKERKAEINKLLKYSEQDRRHYCAATPPGTENKVCGFTHQTANKVKQHIATKHIRDDLKKYICSYPTSGGKKCGKYFEDPFDLQRHEFVHTNVKPFPCPNPRGCKDNFVAAQFVTLKNHVRACCPDLDFNKLYKVGCNGKINMCPLCPTYSVPGLVYKYADHMLTYHPQTCIVRKHFKDGRRINLKSLGPEQQGELERRCTQAATRQNVPLETIPKSNGWEHVMALLVPDLEQKLSSDVERKWVAETRKMMAEKNISFIRPRP